MANKGLKTLKMWIALYAGLALALMAFGTFDLFGLLGDSLAPWVMLIGGLCVIFTNDIVMKMMKR